MTKIFAHRGFSAEYPENTMLAFQKAIECGAEGIELDVHLTSDGVAVIMHDENTLRTCGEDHLIRDLSAEEFLALDAGFVAGGRHGVVHPSTLEAYFELVKDTGLVTNIELKTGVYDYPNIERKTLALIDRFGLRQKVIISSFNHFSVCRFKELAPDVKVGFLEESWLVHPGAYTRNRGAECYHPFFNSLNHDSMMDLRSNHIEINAWTIDSPEDMRRCMSLGLEIGITNHPDRFLAIRRDVCGK